MSRIIAPPMPKLDLERAKIAALLRARREADPKAPDIYRWHPYPPKATLPRGVWIMPPTPADETKTLDGLDDWTAQLGVNPLYLAGAAIAAYFLFFKKK